MTSIIITYINEHDFLAEALQSAMNQGLDQMELILVSNMSVLSKEYQPLHGSKLNFKFIHEPHPGSAFARNAGLQQASGEWLQFLDVDDLILPGKISGQLALAQGAAVVSPHKFKFLNSTTQPSKWLPEDIWCGILNSGLGSTSSMLWHRESLLGSGGWSVNYKSHQEYELLFRLAATGHQISIAEDWKTIVRERASGSITLNTKEVRAKEGIQLREKIWKYLVQQRMDNPARKNAFLQYLFRQLRGLYRIDRNGAIIIYKKYFTGEKFIPDQIGIPFYSFLYQNLGFARTERILSSYSNLRNRYLPFLPTNH
ncbi:MAG: glycosyltransferase family A protein [Saprospiraceae bacterium]